jgi:hypothetical protein
MSEEKEGKKCPMSIIFNPMSALPAAMQKPHIAIVCIKDHCAWWTPHYYRGDSVNEPQEGNCALVVLALKAGGQL